MGTKTTAATKHMHLKGGKRKSSAVTLLPQSIENARQVGDLRMFYRGHLFTGDQLVHLRCQLLNKMFEVLADEYPFNNPEAVVMFRDVRSRLIKKYSIGQGKKTAVRSNTAGGFYDSTRISKHYNSSLVSNHNHPIP